MLSWQEDLIINSVSRKSFRVIAEIIGISIDEIAAFVKNNVDIENIPERLQKINDTRPHRKKYKPEITSARLAPVIKKREEKKYETKKNLNELVAIKIDHRTTIFITADADVEDAVNNFLIHSNYKPIKNGT
jgi:hypothetical protein